MKTILAPALFAALLATLPATAAAKLSPAEAKMAAQVDAIYEPSVTLLQQLVDVNSGSMNFPGVTRIGEMMRAELEPLGFRVEWKPMTAANRAGHIIATHTGKPGTKRLLLIGHLDTVFELDSPFQSWRRDGNDGHGPGAADDKGGIVVMLAALRAMKAAGTLKNADITVVLTGEAGDESLDRSETRARLGLSVHADHDRPVVLPDVRRGLAFLEGLLLDYVGFGEFERAPFEAIALKVDRRRLANRSVGRHVLHGRPVVEVPPSTYRNLESELCFSSFQAAVESSAGLVLG